MSLPDAGCAVLPEGAAFGDRIALQQIDPPQSATAADAPILISTDPSRRLLVTDPKVHLRLLRLCLDLTVTSSGGLDGAYWQQFPLDQGQLYNAEYLLTWHLNSELGAAVVPELLSQLEATAGRKVDGVAQEVASRAAGSVRLLRLMCRSLFEEDRFTELKFQARGAFGNIFRAKMKGMPQQQVGRAGVVDRGCNCISSPPPLSVPAPHN